MRRFAFLAILCALGISKGSSEAVCAETVVIRATKIYAAPDQPAITDGVVVIRGGKIAAIGPRDGVRTPKDARVSECSGVVVAGFQNSHVHFIEERWSDAARRPARELERGLEEMATRYGFTTVFDIASDQANTFALRARVDKGDVRGPRILTAGLPLFPPNGIPFYIHDLRPEVLGRMHQPRTASEARDNVRANLAAGTDATKLFMVTSADGHTMLPMALDIARAAVEETHARGKLVFAHPTSVAGIRTAIATGVDVIAHTTLGESAPWDAALVREMIAARMSIIPTFKLWPYELHKQNVPPEVVDKLVGATLQELRNFMAAGGQVLFGTDVGYMHEYDPTDEYVYMAQAGMTTMQILASLTTAPAARWQESERRGRLKPAADADLVVLAGDPADDVRNFARVRCVYRGGMPIYSAPTP
jgi:imidazolonepropionase-like amidohydrolase